MFQFNEPTIKVPKVLETTSKKTLGNSVKKSPMPPPSMSILHLHAEKKHFSMFCLLTSRRQNLEWNVVKNWHFICNPIYDKASCVQPAVHRDRARVPAEK